MLSNGCLLDSVQKALHCRQRNLKLGMIPSQQLKLNNPYLSVSACVCVCTLCVTAGQPTLNQLPRRPGFSMTHAV